MDVDKFPFNNANAQGKAARGIFFYPLFSLLRKKISHIKEKPKFQTIKSS